MKDSEISIHESSPGLAVLLHRMIPALGDWLTQDVFMEDEHQALNLARSFYDCEITFFDFSGTRHCRVRLYAVDAEGNSGGVGKEDGPASDFSMIVCRAALVALGKLDGQYISEESKDEKGRTVRRSLPNPNRKIKD